MTADTAAAPNQARWRRIGGVLLGAIAGLGIAWGLGLALFARHLPESASGARAPTDAIVVLTGGTARLEAGLKLLAAGDTKQLFVSGVNSQVDEATLLKGRTVDADNVGCCITLDHRAQNTAGNARETRRWLTTQSYQTIRLVTSTYHMPRALLEFRMAAPSVAIEPYPVAPPNLNLQAWWKAGATRRLLAQEYSKYLIALVRYGLYRLGRWVGPSPTP